MTACTFGFCCPIIPALLQRFPSVLYGNQSSIDVDATTCCSNGYVLKSSADTVRPKGMNRDVYADIDLSEIEG